MANLTRYEVTLVPEIRILGRHLSKEPLTLFWTAAGLDMLYTGGELWLNLEADYEAVEPWLAVELNGAWISRFPVTKGQTRACLFRGMTPGKARRVRVLKETQAMHDDPRHLLRITSLEGSGGRFLPLPEPRFRLEFVGDSITSGEGAVGAVCEEDWVGPFFSAVTNYARLTADALGADFRVLSQSGWGIVCGWDNDPRRNMPAYYTEVCGLAKGPLNEAAGAGTPYDFAAWPADAVIINLGSNDAGAFLNAPWEDPLSGETFKLRLLESGAFHPADAELEISRAAAFLREVRARNPKALLVWCYGMGGDRLEPLLKAAVARYREETGDTRAAYLALPATTAETVGARQHPGAANHRAAAAVLTEFLREQGLV